MTEMDNGRVTIREVYGLVERVEEQLSSELKAVSARMEQRFAEHGTEHEKHSTLHQLEEQRRSQMWRWAVTTIGSTLIGLSGWLALWWKW